MKDDFINIDIMLSLGFEIVSLMSLLTFEVNKYFVHKLNDNLLLDYDIFNNGYKVKDLIDIYPFIRLNQ